MPEASARAPLLATLEGADCSSGPAPIPLWTLKAYQFLGTAAWACLYRLIGIYYSDIGLTRSQIGIVTVGRRCCSFLGLLFWARVCDYLGEYKRVLVTCNALGVAVNILLAVPAVQSRFVLVAAVTMTGTFVGSAASSGVVDALCNRVLDRQGGRQSYGDQRLWSSLAAAVLSLLVGSMVDLFGLAAMFAGYALFSCLNLAVMFRYLPAPDAEAAAELRRRRQRNTENLCRFEVVWFLANLLVYGLCMALVEGFLFVYLLQDFAATPKIVVGAAVTVMCSSEIPVFKWFHKVAGGERPRLSLRGVVSMCHVLFAARCVLYALLPASMPWLVLFVEPLHGLTFAFMWNASVVYGKALASPGQEATIQAFITGLYYQLADGMGSLFWGHLAEAPPLGVGFRRCYAGDAAVVLAWAALWRLGWRCRRGASVSSAEAPP